MVSLIAIVVKLREESMFLKGKKCRFFVMAGVPYGYIYLESRNNTFILVAECIQEFLVNVISEGAVTEDEAADIDRAMTEHGILPSIGDVIAKIRAVDLAPELIGDFDDWGFELCANCTDPIPHGNLVHKGEVVVRETPYLSLTELLSDLRDKVHSEVMAPQEAIQVFQKAADLDLPSTMEEQDARFQALPDEVKVKMWAPPTKTIVVKITTT